MSEFNREDNQNATAPASNSASGGRVALLMGASGLVGGELLTALSGSGRYAEIRIITRRHLGAVADSPSVHELIVDFDALERNRKAIVGDDVYCAFGTTIRKAGSKARFRQIDCEYPRELAAIALANGAQHFSLVSSKGASSASRNFYLSVKGELEDALLAMGWPRLTILRPSVIGGKRRETRLLERAGQLLLMKAPTSIRTVPAATIAAVMVRLAAEREEGTRIVESAEILSLSRAYR